MIFWYELFEKECILLCILAGIIGTVAWGDNSYSEDAPDSDKLWAKYMRNEFFGLLTIKCFFCALFLTIVLKLIY